MLLRYVLMAVLAANWPQGAGPEGNWRDRGGGSPPIAWSIALDQSIGVEQARSPVPLTI
jgi:hypothetical protein